MAPLNRLGVSAGVVNDARGAIDNDHLRQRGFWAYLDHPEVGSTLYNRLPVVFSKTPARMETAAPLLGQHTRTVLNEMLEYSETEIDRMIEAEILI